MGTRRPLGSRPFGQVKTTKIFVTGCAGFIASQVTLQLLEEGHEVVGVDDMNDAYDVRLKQWRLRRLQSHAAFRFHQFDISHRPELEALFARERFDAILNLAARAGVRASMENPWVYVETNVTGTLNVLEAARRHDVPRVLLASTSSLYGSRNPRPFREDANTDYPLSPYASSKKGAESMAASFAHLYGLHTPVVRFFTVYGPAGRPDMSMFRFIRWITEGDPLILYGDGTQERDFTYVEDIARGTIAAMKHVRGFDVVNLGSDRPVTLSRMISAIEARVGRSAVVDRRPAHPADVQATWADISKAKRLLDWEPRVSFEEGVERTVAWYMENRDWASKIDLGAA